MKYKKLLLIICPPVWEKMPPLGIAYLCEYLKNCNYQPAVYDLNLHINNIIDPKFTKDWTINPAYSDPDFFNYSFNEFPGLFSDIVSIIRLKGIEHVGFSVFRSNRIFSIKTADFLKDTLPDIKIIFGGPEIFAMAADNKLKIRSVDYFVIGEGERSIIKILEGTSDKVTSFLQLNTVDFFPKFKDFDLGLYKRPGSLPLLSTRGCVNSCSFCLEHHLFKGYRQRDPQDIIEEIKYHKNTGHTRRFTFYDSIFNGDLDNLDLLMELMIKNRLDIYWDAQIAINRSMDTGLMKKMKSAGCINLFVGLESASQKILNKMKKNFSRQDAHEFILKLYKSGLQYELSLILD
ncbi:B12-binding domain-containing radical SAM protein, partial [Elusimicrobiota bacterium]